MSIKIYHQINYVNCSRGKVTMSNTIKQDQEQGYIALYEELEVRYGAALAQEIVDQIKKADEQDNQPEFMAVKAISEALEVFRADTKEIVKKLRNEQNRAFSGDIANLDAKRLQNDLNRLLECYWLSQQAFYKMYRKAMKICEVPETYRYDKYTRPTKMAA